MARLRVVSRHQVSGWRFHTRRSQRALVFHETRLPDDPQRGHATALSIGIATSTLVGAAAAVLAWVQPAATVGHAAIVTDQRSGALFVHIGDRLYPALNLSSARLITGRPDNPVKVPASELAKYPIGPTVGIPGAPNRITANPSHDSTWTVCDTTTNDSRTDPTTDLPLTNASTATTTVIAGPLALSSSSAHPLARGQAELLRSGSTTWLVYLTPDGTPTRAKVDLDDTAVTLALGIDPTTTPVTVSRGLLDAIPESPQLTVPPIPAAGSIATLAGGKPWRVGAVVTAADSAPAAYFVVTGAGLLHISPVLAAMIRNADSQGAVSMPEVAPDLVAANLRAGALAAESTYPATAVRIIDPRTHPVTCFSWSRRAEDISSHTSLMVGPALPLNPDIKAGVVALATASGARGLIADAVSMPRDNGRFVQVTGTEARSPRRESLWWISDNGVRFGVDAEPATLKALDLGQPITAPWSLVSLFAPGPTLSQRDARIQHDGVAADPDATPLPVRQPGSGPA